MTERSPVDAPFDVTITLEEVGGPSAGLMFTLGILDKLGKPSLTGGKYIAGTGEIGRDGEVGPIGGIAQKLRRRQGQGRRRVPRPRGQLRRGGPRRAPADLPLVKVGSLTEALDGLQALRAGDDAGACPAL